MHDFDLVFHLWREEGKEGGREGGGEGEMRFLVYSVFNAAE